MMSWGLIVLSLMLACVLGMSIGAGVVLARRYAASAGLPDDAAIARLNRAVAWSEQYDAQMADLLSERDALDARCAGLRAQAQDLELRLGALRGREIDALEEIEAIEQRKKLLKGLRIS